MKKFKSIDKAVEKVERWIIILSLTLMVVLTFLQVILRTLYTHAHIQWANTLLGHADWTDQFVRLLVLWVTFLGASLLTGDGRHIKIDIVGSLISSRWLSLREIVLSTCCLLICGLMFKASFDYISIEINFGSDLFLGIPSWMCQIILPLGFLVMSFRFLISVLEQIASLARRGRL